MKQMNYKKLIIPNIPYVFFVYLFDKVGQAVRLAPGADISEKILNITQGFSEAFSNALPSVHPLDLLIGIVGAVVIRLIVYVKGKNAKKYRKGAEYGSARWGNAEDIKPYIDPDFQNNIILTQTERLTMNSRPKQPKYARNKNVVVIGGSGSGKTRFFVKPNLMQLHSSYVLTDPKGTVLIECGKLLQRGGYKIKVLNTINFKKSMRYNPFVYIRSEKDVLKVVNTLIVNTVEWWNAKGRYDLVYKSRVFTDTYSKDTITVTNAEQVIFGGTGYDTKNRLPPEVEHSYPDYSIYPQFFGIAYGFLSRGCPRNCGFCIVSSKEGRKSVKVADLSEFWKWQPEIKIMDANLLACPDHENLIEQLIRSRAWVDFSQGLDIRLVNRDNVSLLNRVRIKAVHFAWDNPDEDLTGYFQRFLDLTAIKSSRQRRVYVLTNYGSTHEQDLYRVNTLRATRIFSPPLKKRPPSRLHLSRSQTAQMGISV